MVDEVTLMYNMINLIVLIGVIMVLGYAIIKAVKIRQPFRSENQRNFLKWLMLSVGLAVIQFSLRFVGDFYEGVITEVTHYISSGILMIAGVGLIVTAKELSRMRLGFGKPKGKEGRR